MNADAVEFTIVQSNEPPMESLSAVADHAVALRKLTEWDHVGILCDDGPTAVLLIVLKDDNIVGVSRFCLNVDESVSAAHLYLPTSGDGQVEYRVQQGASLSSAQICSLTALTEVWRKSRDQSDRLNADELGVLFQRLESGAKEKGRGQKVTKPVSRQVCFDAHGRCMFEGCGDDLSVDPTTGLRGNFQTLAHNLASAETGTRGVLFLSGKLSDDPKNILLLCDRHHRVVDTIAKADYPAHRLSEMRRRHCQATDDLLDGLSKLPMPGYCVAWPVHQQYIAVPSTQKIAQAMAPIGARLDGQLNVVTDNDETLRTAELDAMWDLLPGQVSLVADRILMQARAHQFRGALFAIGLMPALIALGAKLGNKCEITPMLRHRESELWYWPSSEPQNDFYEVVGMDALGTGDRAIALVLALTAEPSTMETTCADLGLPVVTVRALNLGNGSLAHPADGVVFRQRIQELLHRLRDQHGVRRVHLLPCASNAACVFFGQAYDNYHPEIVVYDFAGAEAPMVPRLMIANDDKQCVVSGVAEQG